MNTLARKALEERVEKEARETWPWLTITERGRHEQRA